MTVQEDVTCISRVIIAGISSFHSHYIYEMIFLLYFIFISQVIQ